MGKAEADGAELLMGQAPGQRPGLGSRGAVLGVSQDGEAKVGAVDAKLMGSPGEGPELQLRNLRFAAFVTHLQNAVDRSGGLAVRADAAQEAGRLLSGNGRVQQPLLLRRTAEDQSMVGLFQSAGFGQGVHFGVDVGVFRQQHQAEGVPVQTADRVDGAGLAGLLIVGRQAVGQGARVAGRGRVNQHPRRLVQGDEELVLVHDVQRSLLSRVDRRRLIQADTHKITDFHRKIGVNGYAVDAISSRIFQPLDKARGHTQLLPQNRQELCVAPGNVGQIHAFAPTGSGI